MEYVAQRRFLRRGAPSSSSAFANDKRLYSEDHLAFFAFKSREDGTHDSRYLTWDGNNSQTWQRYVTKCAPIPRNKTSNPNAGTCITDLRKPRTTSSYQIRDIKAQRAEIRAAGQRTLKANQGLSALAKMPQDVPEEIKNERMRQAKIEEKVRAIIKSNWEHVLDNWGKQRKKDREEKAKEDLQMSRWQAFYRNKLWDEICDACIRKTNQDSDDRPYLMVPHHLADTISQLTRSQKLSMEWDEIRDKVSIHAMAYQEKDDVSRNELRLVRKSHVTVYKLPATFWTHKWPGSVSKDPKSAATKAAAEQAARDKLEEKSRSLEKQRIWQKMCRRRNMATFRQTSKTRVSFVPRTEAPRFQHVPGLGLVQTTNSKSTVHRADAANSSTKSLQSRPKTSGRLVQFGDHIDSSDERNKSGGEDEKRGRKRKSTDQSQLISRSSAPPRRMLEKTESNVSFSSHEDRTNTNQSSTIHPRDFSNDAIVKKLEQPSKKYRFTADGYYDRGSQQFPTSNLREPIRPVNKMVANVRNSSHGNQASFGRIPSTSTNSTAVKGRTAIKRTALERDATERQAEREKASKTRETNITRPTIKLPLRRRAQRTT